MTTRPTITILSETEADAFVAEWMEAWNSHDLDRILEHYADDVEYYSPFIAQMAEPGGAGADGRIVGQEPVRAYFAAALARNPDLHFEPPAPVGDDVLVRVRAGDSNGALERFDAMEEGWRRLQDLYRHAAALAAERT